MDLPMDCMMWTRVLAERLGGPASYHTAVQLWMECMREPERRIAVLREYLRTGRRHHAGEAPCQYIPAHAPLGLGFRYPTHREFTRTVAMLAAVAPCIADGALHGASRRVRRRTYVWNTVRVYSLSDRPPRHRRRSPMPTFGRPTTIAVG